MKKFGPSILRNMTLKIKTCQKESFFLTFHWRNSCCQQAFWKLFDRILRLLKKFHWENDERSQASVNEKIPMLIGYRDSDARKFQIQNNVSLVFMHTILLHTYKKGLLSYSSLIPSFQAYESLKDEPNTIKTQCQTANEADCIVSSFLRQNFAP